MPRHGSTRRRDRRKNMGHRVHRRSRLVRLAARHTRPTGAWDPEAWTQKHFTPAGRDLLTAPLPPVPPGRTAQAGRKNTKPPKEKPQQPKGQGRGGRGGKGGGGKK